LEIRYFIDPDTGLPHVENHGVAEAEVGDVLRKPVEELAGRAKPVPADGSR